MKKILNILLGILMAVTLVLLIYAIVGNGSDAAISANLIWGYLLFALAVVAALGCAVYGMAKNPAGIKGNLLSLLLIVVIIIAAYFISAGHNIQIPDLANNSVFGHEETVLTEASIIVTYVALGGAIVATVVTEIWRAFK